MIIGIVLVLIRGRSWCQSPSVKHLVFFQNLFYFSEFWPKNHVSWFPLVKLAFTKYLFNLPRVIQDHFQYHSLHPSSGHSLYIKITYYNTGRAHLCLLGAIFNCALLQIARKCKFKRDVIQAHNIARKIFLLSSKFWSEKYLIDLKSQPRFHFQTFRLQNLPFISSLL